MKCKRDRFGLVLWQCACECGNIRNVAGRELIRGNTKSCGCLQREKVVQQNKKSATHGMSKTKTFGIWHGMMKRCYCSSSENFHLYGGRGIKVCAEWHKFEQFFADMGEKPKNMSIERVDNNGNYDPKNCIWADKWKQANNRRSNIYILHKGMNLTISELSRMYGVKRQTLGWRLKKGWAVEEAIVICAKAER